MRRPLGRAVAASAACRAPVPRVFFRDSAGDGRSGAGAEGGVRASASRFEPRKSCSSEGSRVALAAAASASVGCWLGGASAASWVAGGGATSAGGRLGWRGPGRCPILAQATIVEPGRFLWIFRCVSWPSGPDKCA